MFDIIMCSQKNVKLWKRFDVWRRATLHSLW